MQKSIPGNSQLIREINEHGYTLVNDVYSSVEIRRIIRGIEEAFEHQSEQTSMKSRQGNIYGARNFLEIYTDAQSIWRKYELKEILFNVLGVDFGLVRALFFDKPPERSWSLPWHKDLTIAVEDNSLTSEHFGKPTLKSGIAHVEAPQWLLEQMLTLRIHLDEVNSENGPLQVIKGSHDSKTMNEARSNAVATSIHCRAGDVLVMRPLLTHCSGNSRAGTNRHRRIVHLEFAAASELPDGFAWQRFISN